MDCRKTFMNVCFMRNKNFNTYLFYTFHKHKYLFYALQKNMNVCFMRCKNFDKYLFYTFQKHKYLFYALQKNINEYLFCA